MQKLSKPEAETTRSRPSGVLRMAFRLPIFLNGHPVTKALAPTK